MVSFRSNRDVAFEVEDLAAAEEFYGEVMGFELVERRGETLIYETGHLTLYVRESGDPRPPVPSFRVRDLGEAREFLVDNGCEVTAEWRARIDTPINQGGQATPRTPPPTRF